MTMIAEQPELPYNDEPGLVGRDHPETSRDAALRVAPRTGTQRRRVLEAIANGPSTDEEIQFHLNMSGNTQRPRRVELVRGGWIADSGERRLTTGGDAAIVWHCVRAIEEASS